MKRSSLKRGTSRLRRRKKLKARNPARRAKEWARSYHSEERCFYVSAILSCIVPWCQQDEDEYLDNAHAHTGGVGRKGPYTEIFPACRKHHTDHDHGRDRFAAAFGVDPDEVASLTEESWLAYGPDVVARAKADGRYARWLSRHEEGDES